MEDALELGIVGMEILITETLPSDGLTHIITGNIFIIDTLEGEFIHSSYP